MDQLPLIDTPKILNSSSIRAALLEEEKNKRKGKADLIVDNIQKIWNDYLESHSSKGVKSGLKNAKLSCEGASINIVVPTLFIKELISQEGDLMELLRTSFVYDTVLIYVDVNKNAFPDYEEAVAYAPKLTSREVFEKMKSKNPMIQELVQKLGLKPIDS